MNEDKDFVSATLLPHAAPWRVDGTVVRCDVGGFKMVWGSNPYSPPIAYAAALDDAHLIAAAPSYHAAVEQMLIYEQSGGDGWWKGWEMLKAAHMAAKGK